MLYGRFSRNMPYHKKAQWNAEGGVPYNLFHTYAFVLIIFAPEIKERSAQLCAPHIDHYLKYLTPFSKII